MADYNKDTEYTRRIENALSILRFGGEEQAIEAARTLAEIGASDKRLLETLSDLALQSNRDGVRYAIQTAVEKIRASIPDETKRCPFCSEKIQLVAIKCRYCGEWLSEKPEEIPEKSVVADEMSQPIENKNESSIEPLPEDIASSSQHQEGDKVQFSPKDDLSERDIVAQPNASDHLDEKQLHKQDRPEPPIPSASRAKTKWSSSGRLYVTAICLVVAVACIVIFSMGLSERRQQEEQRNLEQKQQEELRALTQSAAEGNADDQFKLAILYTEGKKVPWNQQKAAELLERAANLGNTKAQVRLGTAYYKGMGVPQDFSKALEWWYSAAVKGNDGRAMYELGLLYLEGKGVRSDFNEAARWFELAIGQGIWDARPKLADAQCGLGEMYKHGKGMPHDVNKALELFSRAAENGSSEAQNQLGSAYYYGQGVPENFSKAMEWWRKAAAKGHPQAAYGIGLMYEKGFGVNWNRPEAIWWYRKALQRGDPSALAKLDRLEKEEEKERTRIREQEQAKLRAEAEKAEKLAKAPTVIREVSDIARKYHETHSYSVSDLFVCVDMAIDVWNQLRTKNIRAHLQAGNLDINLRNLPNGIEQIKNVNHVWVMFEVYPGEYLPLEVTAGRVVTGNEPQHERYYLGWEFETPKGLKTFIDARHHAFHVCGQAERLVEIYNRTFAGRRITGDTYAAQGMLELKQTECAKALEELLSAIKKR